MADSTVHAALILVAVTLVLAGHTQGCASPGTLQLSQCNSYVCVARAPLSVFSS